MKLTMCALAILLSVALVSADSRKLLVDDNSSLDNLLQATDFNKIGKSGPPASPPPPLTTLTTTTNPSPPPPPSSPPPPPSTLLSTPASPPPPSIVTDDACPIPDLESYYNVEGCQCDCVVSWGPKKTAHLAPIVNLPPLEPKKKIDLIQDLQDGFTDLLHGRRLQSLVWDIKKNISEDFHAVWPTNMNFNNCVEPVPLVVDHFHQCKCKCPSSSSPPPPTWISSSPPPPIWNTSATTWTPTWDTSSPPPPTWNTSQPTWTPTWNNSSPPPATWETSQPTWNTSQPTWNNSQPTWNTTWTPTPPPVWKHEEQQPWPETSKPNDSWTSDPTQTNP